jgi:hypothetical protein
MAKQDKGLKQRMKQEKKRRAKAITPKVLIGIPVGTDALINVSVASFCSSQAKMGREWKYSCTHRPEDGRNGIIIKYFLPSDYTHLFFLDSDVVPEDDAIDRLLAHKKLIVAGVCPAGGSKGEIRWNVTKDKICCKREYSHISGLMIAAGLFC